MSNAKIYHCSMNGCDAPYSVGFGTGSNPLLCPDCNTEFRNIYKRGIGNKAGDMVHEIKRNRNGRRHSVCEITKQDVLACWPVDNVCPILKQPMIPNTRFAATIDRIDSSLGYIAGNIQIISYRANSMKCDADSRDLKLFAEWVQETYNEAE